MQRRLFATVPALLLASTLAATALASEINTTGAGLAIEGYDPVAYFTEGRPVAGSAAHEAAWQGATWRFASAEHRERFLAEPEAFAPQYGGYCAWAVSEDYTAPIDPAAWHIEDGKLYLNYNRRIQERWRHDMEGRIERGDANWPGILARLGG